MTSMDPDFLNELDDCRFFDVNLSLVKPDCPLIDELLKQLKDYLQLKRFHRSKYQTVVSVLLANIVDKLVKQEYSYLAISFNANQYKTNRYNPNAVGYDVLQSTVRFLLSEGWLKKHKGFYDRRTKDNESRNSRIQPTAKLLGVIHSYRMQNVQTTVHPDKETILLKDEHGDLMDYPDSPLINQMRVNLKLINDQIARSWCDLYITDSDFEDLQTYLKVHDDKQPVDFSEQSLVRIFNNRSFDYGGRFYRGWWQHLPNNETKGIGLKLRNYIRIDDSYTREYDYKALHPNLLYLRAGLSMPIDDPYTIDGYEQYRKALFKPIFNAILNAKHRQSFINKSGLRREVFQAGFEGSLEDIVLLLEKKHEAIKQYFFSGIGLELQREDSDLLEAVMLNCIKDDITVLPIHDSIISRLAHSVYIEEEMRNCFQDRYGIVPVVTLDEEIEKEVEILSSSKVDVVELMAKQHEEYSSYYERRRIKELS